MATSGRPDKNLETVVAAALRKDTDPVALGSALAKARRFPLIGEALAGLGDDFATGPAVERIRTSLRAALPVDRNELAERVGLSLSQSRVVYGVLAGLSIADAVTELNRSRPHGEQLNKSTGSRWMTAAAERISEWIALGGPLATGPAEDDGLASYLRLLRAHCAELPSWFPAGLRFTDILQEVTVTPPGAEGAVPAGDPASDHDRTREEAGGPRRLAWATALQQYRRLVLLGDAGSGKSWAVRGRALRLIDDRLDRGLRGPVPVLLYAPRLEELLAAAPPPPGDRAALASLLATALPDEVTAAPDAAAAVAALLRERAPAELLIDGYDEIRQERPRLLERLSEILQLLHPEHGRFVLTSRPAALPQHRLVRLAAACELKDFAEREQRQFIRCWFHASPESARPVERRVAARNLEILRRPLLIALFCAVADDPAEQPFPETEHELWQRALDRLAAEEGRYAEQAPTSEIVRLRKRLLEEVAVLFQDGAGLLDSVEVAAVTDALRHRPDWAELARTTAHATVVDDLVGTGIVHKASVGHQTRLVFLHGTVRDYLLARALARNGGWTERVGRLWTQPEWEQVLGHVGSLVDDPGEVVLALQSRFGDDPLNAARFAAGRILPTVAGRVEWRQYTAVRDELLILLGSADPVDRGRSAALLSALRDDETGAMVRGLVHPAVPTHVVIAALRTIASGAPDRSLDVLTGCARSADFTLAERKAAVDALADTGTAAALGALEELAADATVIPSVRTTAAYSALRLFDAPGAARLLLSSDAEPSQEPRRLLAERLAQAEHAGAFAPGTGRGLCTIADPYCRALLDSDGTLAGAAPLLVEALPANPVVDRLAQAVETARARAEDDPLMVTCGRFVLAAGQPPVLRDRLARLVAAAPDRAATAVWHALTEQVTPRDNLQIAEFLIREVAELPDRLAGALRGALAAGDLGPVAKAQYEHTVREETTAARTPPPADDGVVPAEDPGGEAAPSLEEVLAGGLPPIVKYAFLRTRRRSLPDRGAVRTTATKLTHLLSTEDVTHWIDALPAIAVRVDDRLREADDATAYSRLLRLRSQWPDRYGEIADMGSSFGSAELDARAEAALLADEFDDAAAKALASFGARLLEGKPPTTVAATVLYAAGCVSRGRAYTAHHQVNDYLKEIPDQARTFSGVILGSWLNAAAMAFPKVADGIGRLPGWMLRTEAEVAGLRMAAGLAGPEAFDEVVSWAGCRRTAALLATVGALAATAGVRRRIAEARTVALNRADDLAERWPRIDRNAPEQRAAPKWSEMLIRIASRQLMAGRPEVAIGVYESAVEESPGDPRLVNNLGFCLMPVDPDAALTALERAAALFRRPYGVNVANRMLLHLMRDDPAAANRIGDAYHRLGRNDGAAWLWDMDDPQTLRDGADIALYIIELGRRAALQVHDYPQVERWERRRALRRPAGPLPEGDEHGS
ncbi:NACHT domain-containing protein [Actinomadura parmotrematis]|uniref:NACHT domain-containing protein n=1 Tax=Actinomadura parmotrematis TaxID=2864039 RepID=A0ABS7G4C4_9ACTN|nr:NACHT domain-containing protein [Actinomadura parmotrematis]MBW8486657.1 NACHT domain-containing protein [Actinomadura parmotrematis]